MSPANAAPSRFYHHPTLQIHFCVLLWGFTAILGKLITLAALPLVFWRMSLVCLCLLAWPRVWRQLCRISRRDALACAGIGILVTLHWLSFYGAIKLANASVAATCIALSPVFLSLIEPWLGRRPINRGELLLAILAVPGVALVVDGVPSGMMMGFWLGVLSALLAALFSMANKRMVTQVPALAMTGIEMAIGALLLGLCIPLWPLLGSSFGWPGQADWLWLIVLALACTLLPFALSLVALRRISAFSAVLAVNLEPVYAIVLAALFLGETRELGLSFYLGVLLILAAVIGHGLGARKS